MDRQLIESLFEKYIKYIGTVTIYSHLQACGMINDRDSGCLCFHRINDQYPVIRMRADNEA